jgi:hypothetical protein
MPVPVFGFAAVPAALMPIQLFRTMFSPAMRRRMPSPAKLFRTRPRTMDDPAVTWMRAVPVFRFPSISMRGVPA